MTTTTATTTITTTSTTTTTTEAKVQVYTMSREDTIKMHAWKYSGIPLYKYFNHLEKVETKLSGIYKTDFIIRKFLKNFIYSKIMHISRSMQQN